jgi:hypothetical protein
MKRAYVSCLLLSVLMMLGQVAFAQGAKDAKKPSLYVGSPEDRREGEGRVPRGSEALQVGHRSEELTKNTSVILESLDQACGTD